MKNYTPIAALHRDDIALAYAEIQKTATDGALPLMLVGDFLEVFGSKAEKLVRVWPKSAKTAQRGIPIAGFPVKHLQDFEDHMHRGGLRWFIAPYRPGKRAEINEKGEINV